MSIAGSGRCLSFNYQISSPRIELVIYTSTSGDAEFLRTTGLKYTDQDYIGRWNYAELALYSNVEAVRLVAMKTGVTTHVEYVLVDVINIESCFDSGPEMNN